MCTMASLVEQGILRSGANAEILHAKCEGHGCGCGCESSSLPRCSECDRARTLGELTEAGECADVTDCGRAILERGARPAVVVPVRPPKASPAPQKEPVGPKGGRCHCCGETTRGGRFLPGHDAKLKTALTAGAVAGDAAATRELLARWPKWSPKTELEPMTEAEVAAATEARWASAPDPRSGSDHPRGPAPRELERARLTSRLASQARTW
jgi:hypothetical protein